MEQSVQARPRAVRRHRAAASATARVGAGADYVDVFELATSEPDERTPEQLVRLAFSRAPGWWLPGIAWAHRRVLRFRLVARDDPHHFIGWRIVESDESVFRLDTTGPLMAATLSVVKLDTTRAQLVTALTFRRRLLSRVVWAAVGPVHRRAAPALMERTAAS